MSKPMVLGLLVGVLAGVGVTLYVTTREAPVPTVPPGATTPLDPHGGAMPGGDPHGGAMPGTNPHGGAMPGTDPHGGAMPMDGAHGGGDGHDTTFAKVHFMRKFLAALTEQPQNLMPAADWKPLIKEGAAPLKCADCHDPSSLNIEALIEADPGDEAVQPLRMRRRGFMIPLMEKWVARLNERHADRLTKEVTCADCHDQDPRDDEARNATIPPLMIKFVRALKEPPANENPAPGWKPLLKDPGTSSMLCATCHGQIGASMEKNLAALEGPPSAEAQENHQFMVNLMERWVRELNKRAKEQLVKAVVCTDCHEVDPRK